MKYSNVLLRFYDLWHNEFARQNLVLFCGTILVAMCNYLYHPVLGRLMTLEDFGETQIIISLFTQFTIICGIFKIIVVNAVANNKDRSAVASLFGITLFITASLAVLLIILSPVIGNFLQFRNAYSFVALALALCSYIIIIFNESILQGEKRFWEMSLSQIICALNKVIFAVVFVWLGWSVLGASLGIVVAQILTLIYLSTRIGNIFNIYYDKKIIQRIRANMKYVMLVMSVSLAISTFFAFDVLVVKRFFSTETAGLYSGVSVIAKVVYFATASVVGVMLPSIKLNDKKANFLMLKKSIKLMLLVGGGILLVFTVFSKLIITLMLGSRYEVLANLLPVLSVLFFLISMINLLFTFSLAIRNFKTMWIAVTGFVALLILSAVNHQTLSAVVFNSLIVSVLVIAFTVINLSSYFKKHE